MSAALSRIFFIAAMFSTVNVASAAILSITGAADTADLRDAGDSVSGVMNIDGTDVDYTLELTAENVVGDIFWNGPGRSEPGGLSWDDGSGDNSWTLELSFSRTVNLVFSQVGQSGLANEPGSVWTIQWDSNGQTAISDPDNQLDDPITTAGAGFATFSSLSRIGNGNATWSISGPDSSTYVIDWSSLVNGPGTDAIGINTTLSRLSAVPLPAGLWLLGSALGVLGWMRRSASRRHMQPGGE
jgi:hypothetical protein